MEGGGSIQFCHSGFFQKEIAYLVLIAGNGGSKNTSLLQWGGGVWLAGLRQPVLFRPRLLRVGLPCSASVKLEHDL